MSAYLEYKPCEGDWIKEIPATWEIVRGKYLFEIKKRIVGEVGHDVLSITQKGIKVKDTESGDGQLSMDYSKYQIVEPGDFAMNHMDLLTGYVDISKYQGVTSPDYRVFTSKEAASSPRYFLYVFQMGYTNKIFFKYGQGASHLGRWRLPTEEFNNFWFPCPPKEDRESIADFLDYEIGRIDTLIEKQQQLIKLLKEKRQAVISHAVTKGLNPNAPMRDSGVEWLGEVPEHWTLGRLKNVLRIRNGKDYKDVEVEEGGYPVYGSGGIFRRSSDYLYEGKSVLFGRKGTIDKPLVVSGKFWTVDTMFYSEVFDNALPEYIYFQATMFPFSLLSTNTALPSMTQEDLLELPFVIPPSEEQSTIVSTAQEKSEEYDHLIAKAESAIQLMQERRTALISAAVTGKIDVRNWQSPEPSDNQNKEVAA